VVRGPIIIDAQTLNAHPTILSQVPDHSHHHHHHHHHHVPHQQQQQQVSTSGLARGSEWSTSVQWCSSCRNKSDAVGVTGASTSLGTGSSSDPRTPSVVGCLLGVYSNANCSSGPSAPHTSTSHFLQGVGSHHPNQHRHQSISSAPPTSGCRACCCYHQQQQQQPASAVQLTSQRGGISLRVARVASTTSIRTAPYAHSQHQGLRAECRY
jgi:hypothetical protein